MDGTSEVEPVGYQWAGDLTGVNGVVVDGFRVGRCDIVRSVFKGGSERLGELSRNNLVRRAVDEEDVYLWFVYGVDYRIPW